MGNTEQVTHRRIPSTREGNQSIAAAIFDLSPDDVRKINRAERIVLEEVSSSPRTPAHDAQGVGPRATDGRVRDSLKPGALGEHLPPPVVCGNPGYRTDAAGKSIEEQASAFARNCVADAIARQAVKCVYDMSEDDRGHLLAALLNAEAGSLPDPAWQYKARHKHDCAARRERRVEVVGVNATTVIALDDCYFERQDQHGNLIERMRY